MNVTIIGNQKTNGDIIKGISDIFINSGADVRYSSDDGIVSSEDSVAIESFERIDWSDIVIAVPKSGLTFAQSVLMEVTYAKYRKKKILIFYE